MPSLPIISLSLRSLHTPVVIWSENCVLKKLSQFREWKINRVARTDTSNQSSTLLQEHKRKGREGREMAHHLSDPLSHALRRAAISTHLQIESHMGMLYGCVKRLLKYLLSLVLWHYFVSLLHYCIYLAYYSGDINTNSVIKRLFDLWHKALEGSECIEHRC